MESKPDSRRLKAKTDHRALTPGELAVLDPLGGQVVGARY